MLEFPEHKITRPKTIRLTPQGIKPTGCEVEVAIDIIIRAAMHSTGSSFVRKQHRHQRGNPDHTDIADAVPHSRAIGRYDR